MRKRILAGSVATFVLLGVFPPTGEMLAQRAFDPIPYHTVLSADSPNLSVVANVPAGKEVPADKRLIIEYVSLKLHIGTGTVPFATECLVSGAAPPTFFPHSHNLTLHERSSGSSAMLTASEPVRTYLPAGASPKIECTVGVTGIPLQVLGWVSGQLVDAE